MARTVKKGKHLKSGNFLKSIFAEFKTDYIYIGIISLISIAVYSRAFYSGFVLDDKIQVLENPLNRDIANIPKLFSSGIVSYVNIGAGSNNYRPMMNVIYTLNYDLFGPQPWAFHLTNVLLHAGTSILVFFLINKILCKSARKPLSSLPAFIAALLFAIHPIHTEAVIWVAAVPELSYTLFFLLSFYLYMKGREGSKTSYLFSWVSFALATLCKEPAITLPVILVGYDYVCRKPGERLFEYVKRYAPYLLIIAGYLLVRHFALHGFAPREPNIQLYGYEYFINIFPLFGQYLGKLLLPVNLNAIYVFHPIFSIFSIKGMLSIAVTAVFISLSIVALRKRNMAILGSLMIAVPLVPVLIFYRSLGIFAFADRYLYLPSFGFVLLVGLAISWFQTTKTKAMLGVYIITILVLGFYSFGTISRIPVWKNEFTLYSDIARKAPDSFFAHNFLGRAYAKQGRINEAINELETALKLKPDLAEAHYNLGLIYMSLRRNDDAVNEFKAALMINPYFTPAREMLNLVLRM